MYFKYKGVESSRMKSNPLSGKLFLRKKIVSTKKVAYESLSGVAFRT